MERLEDLANKHERTGAEILVDTLNESNVEYIFGHTGGAIISIHDELGHRYANGLKAPKFILCVQEGAAGHMAEGYAAASGKVGVALATSGPGATNLVTPIADSYMDSRSVVFITGQVDKRLLGTDAFQEVDIVGITTPITKHNYLIEEADDIGWTVRQAFHLSSTGRPGPIVIDICKNALAEKSKNSHEERNMPGYNPYVRLDEEASDRLLEDLVKHERPVILAGGGVINSGAAEELREFAEKYNIPVASTFKALGVMPYSHDLALGMPGMHGTIPANYALRDADFILAIGTRFDDRVAVKDFGKGKRIAHIDLDAAEINKIIHAHHEINADAKDFLEYALSYSSNPNSISGWNGQIKEWKEEYPLKYCNDGSVKPQYAIQHISGLAEDDAIVTTGVGQHQMWTALYFDFNSPDQLISSGGLGTMGFGLPAAIGAYFAKPDNQVICIDGDGSFKMNMQELEVIDKYKMPIKIFVINNGSLGMVDQWQNGFFRGYNQDTHLNRNSPNILGLSHVYENIETSRVTTNEELAPKIKDALQSKKPYIVDIWVDPEDVLPMIPPGGTLNDSIK